MQTIHSTTQVRNPSDEGFSQIVEQHNTTSTGQESSAEIRESTKGGRGVTVKAYHADPMQAVDDAIAMYDRMLTHLGEKK